MTDFPVFISDILVAIADFLWMPAVRYVVMALVLCVLLGGISRFLRSF